MLNNVSELYKELEDSGLKDLIIKLDHVAYRVKKGERERAMAEFAKLVPYKDYKTFKVLTMNAITSTLKLHVTLIITCV